MSTSVVGLNRKAQIAVIPTLTGSDTLENFPVLFSVFPSEVWHTTSGTQTNGGDIRFTSDEYGFNMLNIEILSWSKTSSAGNIYVKMPQITSAISYVWMWYKSDSGVATQPASNDIHGSEGVWSEKYEGVWHLKETAGDYSDSTSNALSGQSIGNLPDARTGSQAFIYTSQHLDGVGDRIKIPGFVTNETSGFSGSLWANPTAFATSHGGNFFGKRDPSTGDETGEGWEFLIAKNDTPNPPRGLTFVVCDVNGKRIRYKSTASMSGNVQHHYGFSYDGGLSVSGIKLYLDGIEISGTTQLDNSLDLLDFETSFPLSIGSRNGDNDNMAYEGYVEAAKIRTGVTTPAWFYEEYYSAENKSSYTSAGSPQAASVVISGTENLLVPNISSSLTNLGKVLNGNIDLLVPTPTAHAIDIHRISATGDLQFYVPTVTPDEFFVGEYFPIVEYNFINPTGYNSEPLILSATVSYQFPITSADGLSVYGPGNFTGKYKQTALNQYIVEINVSASGTLTLVATGLQPE